MKEAPSSELSERSRVRKAVLRWEAMDEPGRRAGRGLGRKELLSRVALEVGVGLARVHAALRA